MPPICNKNELPQIQENNQEWEIWVDGPELSWEKRIIG
jgi:hypothetical protein